MESKRKKQLRINAGKAIAKFIKLQKVSIPLLAKKTGIKIADIKGIINNKRAPKRGEIKSICKAIDIPISVIVLYSIEKNDVAPTKRELFKKISPTIKSIIEGFIVIKEKKPKSKK